MPDRQQIIEGFQIEYREDGIIVYHAIAITRESVDAWFEVSTQHDREYAEAGKHLRRIMIYNATLPSPYTFYKVKQAADISPPNLKESYALVMPYLIGYNMIHIVVTRMPQKAQSVTRLFRDEDTAIQWLKQRLEEIGD